MRAALLAALAATAAAPAWATTARALHLDEHVAISTAVVEARIGAPAVSLDATGRPFTDTHIKVERILHGVAPGSFHIRQMKGERFGVVGDGDLRPGARAVLFVKRGEDGRWYLTALAQSVFHVKGDTDDAPAERDLEGLGLIEPDAQGRWVPAPADAKSTLRELRAAVLAASRRARR